MTESQALILNELSLMRERTGYALDAVRDIDILPDPKANVLAALEQITKAGIHQGEAATELIQLGYDYGLTKKAIAEAADIPPGMLTGMVKR